jgi:hypothetical protein
MCIVFVVLRDLGDKGNIIAEAQLLSRRDKVLIIGPGDGESSARYGTTAVIEKEKKKQRWILTS